MSAEIIMRHFISKLSAAALITTLSTSAFITPANAHATFDVKEASVNTYQRLAVRIGHGCDGQSTQKVTITIPEGIISVKPMPKAGWSLETITGDYAVEYENHGRKITSGVKQIIWSGNELDDGHYDEFIFRARLTDDLQEGNKLFFPVVQNCADGELSWSETPADGQDPHDLKRPAPGVMIKAAADEHAGHHGHSTPDMQTVSVGDLKIMSPIIRATPPNAPVSAGYMMIQNNGSETDRLIGGTAAFAGKVEVHEMKMEGDVMKMRRIDGGLEIPAGGEVTLKSGGLHVMFMKLAEQMVEGETRKISLEFEKAGSVEFEIPVKKVERGHHGHSK
jgi:uncharacterized protein YcnI/copper(I)-binding protein